MKKLIIIISIFVLLLATTIFLISLYDKNDIEEVVYSIKTNYSYLSDGDTKINIKLYTNNKNSLLKHAKEAVATLHDRKEETVVTVEVLETQETSNTTFNNTNLYEYTVKILVSITKLKISDCCLSLKFSNKKYTFNIGDIEIEENNYQANHLKITNLYGLSKEDDLSLSGIVLTIINDGENAINITSAKIGNSIKVVLNNLNKTSVDDSQVIEDYNHTLTSENITVEIGEANTFILPIINDSNNYLYDCYLLFEINGEFYYFSNFTYINSNDLDSLQKYVSLGKINEI